MYSVLSIGDVKIFACLFVQKGRTWRRRKEDAEKNSLWLEMKKKCERIKWNKVYMPTAILRQN